MLLWWFASALAAPCPDVSEQTGHAWAAFHDAELDLAEAHLDEALASLTCQQRVVQTPELLELHRLQGLVALARQDRQGALYATIRTVTIDPDAPPAPELGPDLAAMHETWAGRLSAAKIVLRRVGEGEAWVDGQPIDADSGTRVVSGEHLLQARDTLGWHATLLELSEDTAVSVGGGLALGPLAAPDLRVVPRQPERRAGPFARPHRVELLAIGGAAAAAGAGLIVGGAVRHGQFKRDDYLPAAFGSCEQGQECYGLAREQAIRSDALTIQILYGTGYALTALGVTTLGVELFLLPSPATGGGLLGARGRW